MARMLTFSEGEILIGQGDERDTVAYLIHSGWLQIRRKHPGKQPSVIQVGPGEIVGELGLAGVASNRTATVTALTDGEVEVIDRGALIRLVNGPGSRLTPLLAALFLRLQSLLLEADKPDEPEDEETCIHGKLEGANKMALQALCNQSQPITRLPWVFGAYIPPVSVTDIFRQHTPADVLLINSTHTMREDHLRIEASENGGLQLRIMQPGDFCEVDDERVGRAGQGVIPLPAGKHSLRFGDPREPYEFSLRVFDN